MTPDKARFLIPRGVAVEKELTDASGSSIEANNPIVLVDHGCDSQTYALRKPTTGQSYWSMSQTWKGKKVIVQLDEGTVFLALVKGKKDSNLLVERVGLPPASAHPTYTSILTGSTSPAALTRRDPKQRLM